MTLWIGADYTGAGQQADGGGRNGAGSGFTPGTPETLFQTHIASAVQRPQYDVARDDRFLINTEIDDTSGEQIHLLMNWRSPAQ
jgi:hypothetical protein